MKNASSGEGGGEQSNRPENTKFKQQKLDAWQPILTPTWVIGTFFVVGIVFVPVGAYLWNLSNRLFESSVMYDSFDRGLIPAFVSQSCQISHTNEGFDKLRNGSRTFSDCQLSFTFTQDIAEGQSVYLYYQLNNFYQNHRRYVKSLSEPQLMGQVTINPVTMVSNPTLETACDPVKSFSSNASGTNNRIFYPCGLIARSVFNDGISISGFNGSQYWAGAPVGGAPPEIKLVTNNTAWPSDLNNKYRNPTASSCSADLANPGGNLCPLRYYQYVFLWQAYNQFLCYPAAADGAPNVTAPPDNSQCVNYTELVNTMGVEQSGAAAWAAAVSELNSTMDGLCAMCRNASSVLVSAGGILPPDNTTNDHSNYGIRTAGFAVWMRTAGLPTFRKLYGEVLPPKGGFKTGNVITFAVQPNFVVNSVQASKSLVLMTTSSLGGKNDVLGVAYMAVGAICLFLAVVFAIKMKVQPRKLGDPQYLQWKKK